MTVRHWHVATGLAGYGPDGSDGYDTAENLRDVSDAIRDRLRDFIDSNDQGARAVADTGDYKDAWETMMLAESLETLSTNLNNKRGDSAPLYVGKPKLWDETLDRIIGETFPLDVSYNTRLYVWECDTAECDHLDESE